MKAVQTEPVPTADEVLCAKVAQGDSRAEEELVLRYNRVVRICARPYFLVGGDGEDLIQEGMVGLLNAIREFLPNKGTSFRTYAETCIRNRILSAIRAAARDKHTPLNYSVSFESPLSDGNSDSYAVDAIHTVQTDPEVLFITREEHQERLGTLKGQLSGFEAKILDLFLKGLSYAEIAVQTRRSPKAVDNAVQRIRRKVAQHLSSGDFSVR